MHKHEATSSIRNAIKKISAFQKYKISKFSLEPEQLIEERRNTETHRITENYKKSKEGNQMQNTKLIEEWVEALKKALITK